MATLRIRLIICKAANREHATSLRQYAHTFHHKGVICVASAYWSLPFEHQLGLLYHELGHLLAGPDGSEEDADRFTELQYGVRIEYRDSRYGDDLQYASAS